MVVGGLELLTKHSYANQKKNINVLGILFKPFLKQTPNRQLPTLSIAYFYLRGTAARICRQTSTELRIKRRRLDTIYVVQMG